MISSAAREGAARGLTIAALALGGAVVSAACRENTAGVAPVESASARPVASAPVSAKPVDDSERDGDEVRPVYRVDNQPLLPLAEKYCDVVRETPRKRREACCPGMGGFAPTAECARTLSSALRSGAMTLDTPALEACAAAVTKDTEGCDWVASSGSPTVAACLGILKGTIKQGGVCRSNLECEEGLRCHGLGATRPGKCGPPYAARRTCNVATDSLASFTGQDDFDLHHPECAGHCVRRQCADAVAVGGACKSSLECGVKGTCVDGKCSDGPRPEAGKACTDVCAAGARCSKGKCVATKAGGEECSDDAECRGACEKGDAGTKGRCAKQCPSIPAAK